MKLHTNCKQQLLHKSTAITALKQLHMLPTLYIVHYHRELLYVVDEKI